MKIKKTILKMKNLKQFNDYSINESNNDELIGGSGLFTWNSNLDDNTQVEIVNWYRSLSSKDKKFVDILRNEARDDAENNAAELAAGEDI